MKSFIQEYKGYLTILIFILLMTLFTIYGDRGLTHLSRLSQEAKRIEMVNEGLKDENKALKKELFLLKNHRGYQEKIIREELGFVRRDETVYQFQR